MARAVIEFKKDIGHLIPLIGKSVEGCAYNPESNIAGFQVNNLRIIIGQNRMNIYGTDDEPTIKKIIDWLIDRISENHQ
ncbi:MAG: hypothetical protein A2158_02170 [Chloroflexi bacterium RBG_13_46_14]|nr:MAG: hypothetical protein A2158_02170 [Chloroflexi bacterium RBG_13_46_14]